MTVAYSCIQKLYTESYCWADMRRSMFSVDCRWRVGVMEVRALVCGRQLAGNDTPRSGIDPRITRKVDLAAFLVVLDEPGDSIPAYTIPA